MISRDYAEKLSAGTGGSYFTLKNDKDFAVVRLMYGTPDDIMNDIYSVHDTQDGKFECARKNWEDPISVCPICMSTGKNGSARVFLRLYNEDAKQAQVWERSYSWVNKTLLPQLVEMCKDFPEAKVCQFPIKIVRNGASGDMQTVYNLFCKNPDATTLESLGEPAAINLKDCTANAPVNNTAQNAAPTNATNTATDSNNDLFRGM